MLVIPAKSVVINSLPFMFDKHLMSSDVSNLHKIFQLYTSRIKEFIFSLEERDGFRKQSCYGYFEALLYRGKIRLTFLFVICATSSGVES